MSRSSFNPSHVRVPARNRKALPGQRTTLADKLNATVKRDELPVQSDHMQTPEAWAEVWRK